MLFRRSRRIKGGELVNCSTPLLYDSWFPNQSPVGTAAEVGPKYGFSTH